MRFNDIQTASYAIAEMAEDVWHNREYVLQEDDPFYLAYRVSVSQHEPVITDHNVYFHVVITRHRWFYLISDKSSWEVYADDVMRYERDYRDSAENDRNIRGESYRHYLFSDCFQPAIYNKLKEIQKTLENPDKPYLWSTLPVEVLLHRDNL